MNDYVKKVTPLYDEYKALREWIMHRIKTNDKHQFYCVCNNVRNMYNIDPASNEHQRNNAVDILKLFGLSEKCKLLVLINRYNIISMKLEKLRDEQYG